MLQPSGPQHSGARDPASAGDHALRVDGLNLDSGQDLHAELREASGRPARQRLSKGRQDPFACVEQNDAGLCRIDAAEISAQGALTMCARDAASSTPVGPAPTSTNVIRRARSASSSVVAANSNAPRILARIVAASLRLLSPGAYRANSSWPK